VKIQPSEIASAAQEIRMEPLEPSHLTLQGYQDVSEYNIRPSIYRNSSAAINLSINLFRLSVEVGTGV
jgi:hypothetical protein